MDEAGYRDESPVEGREEEPRVYQVNIGNPFAAAFRALSRGWRGFLNSSEDGSIVWLFKKIAQWAGIAFRALRAGLQSGVDRLSDNSGRSRRND